MCQQEFKTSVKEIIESLNTAIENSEECFEEYYHIMAQVDEDTEVIMDCETTKEDILTSCIKENEYIKDCLQKLNAIVTDLETWRDKSSDDKSKQITEKYIDIIEGIEEELDLENIENEEELKKHLNDAANSFKDLLN